MYSILALCCAMFFVACGPCDGNCGKDCCKKLKQPTSLKENPKEWQGLYEKVMYVHDEVMPEMGTINRLKQDLKRYSTKHSDKIDETQRNQIAALTAALEKGEKAMWDWMHAFKQPEAEAPLDEVNAYLKKELETISEVSDLMKTSMKDAENFLDTNGYK